MHVACGCARRMMPSAMSRYWAAVAVWFTSSARPDPIVATIMAALFLSLSFHILHQPWTEYWAGQEKQTLTVGA